MKIENGQLLSCKHEGVYYSDGEFGRLKTGSLYLVLSTSAVNSIGVDIVSLYGLTEQKNLIVSLFAIDFNFNLLDSA